MPMPALYTPSNKNNVLCAEFYDVSDICVEKNGGLNN